MSILFLKPALVKKDAWGGRRLIDDYGMKTDLPNVGEAWMLSCHEDGESHVIGGEYDGYTLERALAHMDGDPVGLKARDFEDFPLLIKLIDARDDLSVQVHPDDEYAEEHERDKRGKTECWYILDADEGSELIYGFRHDMASDEFRRAIADNTLLEYCNRVKVHPGDTAFIPSGTLHAIGKGILLAEVQQSCNTTYRVYDYDRLVDGEKRELHIDKAVDVTNCTPPEYSLEPEGMPVMHDGYRSLLLRECDYFIMSLVEVEGVYADSADEDSFVSIIVLEGEGEITGSDGGIFPVRKGDSIFIPADDGNFYVSGKVKLLVTTL